MLRMSRKTHWAKSPSIKKAMISVIHDTPINKNKLKITRNLHHQFVCLFCLFFKLNVVTDVIVEWWIMYLWDLRAMEVTCETWTLEEKNATAVQTNMATLRAIETSSGPYR